MGLTLRDRVPSREIREKCETQNVVRWIRKRRRAWNEREEEHVGRRMEEDRLIKIAGREAKEL